MQHFEKAQKLGEQLAIFRAHGHASAFKQAEFMDDAWGAAYFCAKILMRSAVTEEHNLSMQRLTQLRDQFLAHTGYAADLDDLFEKGWLRFVFGNVCLPTVFRSRSLQTDFVKKYANEIRFFEGLTDVDRVGAKTLPDLQNLIKVYETQNSLVLDLAESAKHFYSVGQTGQLNYHNTGLLAYMLNNIHLFDFMQTLVVKKFESPLIIRREELLTLYREHSAVFPGAPTLHELIEKEVFVLHDDKEVYFIDFDPHKFGVSHHVLSQAAGLLWGNLLKQGSHGDAAEKLRFWYYRTVYHSEHWDFTIGFSTSGRKKFFDTALQIVMSDPDLKTGKSEYRRLCLDNRHAYGEELLPVYEERNAAQLESLSSDLFDDYESIVSMNNGHGNDFLIVQGCRHPICFLTAELVKQDDHFLFNYTNELLRLSQTKPLLFWKTTFTLGHNRPSILPFLLIKQPTAALAFHLLVDMNTDPLLDISTTPAKNELIIKAFELMTDALSTDNTTPAKEKARTIFQCLRLNTDKKFWVQFANHSIQQETYQDEQLLLSSRIRAIFSAVEMPGQVFNGYQKYKNLFFPLLLDDLTAFTMQLKPPGREVGQLYLPYTKLDLQSFIFKLSLKKDQAGQPVSNETTTAGFLKGFLDTYLDTMNCSELEKGDLASGELKKVVPHWMTDTTRDELIDWGNMMLHMEKNFMLEDFLTPAGLKFTNAVDKYDEFNRLVASKLRNHISILILAYNDISRKAKPAAITGLRPDAVLNSLEITLTGLISRYSIFNAEALRYDIFDESLERWTLGSARAELLPVVGTLINKFNKSNREKIIGELIKAEQVIRSLKLVDYVVSEAERTRLLNIIVDENDLPGLMDKLSYADQQFLIQSLTKNEAFVNQAEEALRDSGNPDSKRKISYREDENKLYHFRAQLLLAYHKKDLQAVADAEDPSLNIHNFNVRDERLFYEALIYLELDDPEKSYQLFNQLLTNSSEDKPVFALNRFAAHSNWAAKTSVLTEQRRHYSESLAEWTAYEQSVQPGLLQGLTEKITLNKLEALEALEEDTHFDELYVTLDKDIRLKPYFLIVRMKNLMRRKMQPHAEQLLIEARLVHTLADGSYPPFIGQLEMMANTPETIAYLAEQHNRIINLPPEKLIQVISGNGVAVMDIAEFLLDEILEASAQLLLKINAVSDVNYEDKYSDLLAMVMNSRLQHFHWSVHTSRGGYSDPEMESKKKIKDVDKNTYNVGEIDLGIFSATNELLAICEALNLGGKNTAETQKHNLKIFNYDPSRKLYYVIVYFKGSADKFNDAWSKYIDVVEDFINFPIGYEIEGKLLELKLPNTSATVKAGKTKHVSETVIYHVFVNIYYKLELDKKFVRDKDATTPLTNDIDAESS